MKIRLVALIAAAICLQPFAFAQQMPLLTVPKVGKLTAGDTLSISIFKKPDQQFDTSINLNLKITVLNDGTISVPLLFERVPAAGLSISQLTSDLEQRYASYFAHFGPSPTFTPPRVAIGFLGHPGKTAQDNVIERLAKPAR
jgi:protein involved in polysaccharide export with SLBB domain